ncbi:CPBP family intramembrane glutamic endopeptidase [Calothrix sp. 336/3]|uniref:CPBP family intramembrane glutamic endopeptidase n=1 Tax=Calothrix sp. 336/3 TaxID=1337936 RepID=UPI0004E325F9|nr:CPBP family intramembrane glutamic endopeptidase [Calothrix sp. 336/3]AKG23429.1 abortive phage infection protein [Calothrix sp. 336/3]
MTQHHNQDPEVNYLSRTQVLVAMAVTAIALWIVAKIWLNLGQVSLMSWRWNIKDLLVGLGLGLSITGFSGLAYQYYLPYRQSANYYLDIVLKPLVIPDLIWLGILPGISEELLFRGVMIPALGYDHFAVILSSLCFGILHLSGSQQWAYVIWATIIGLVLGYSAVLSGNLLVPIVAHIITNVISSYMWKIGRI